MQLYTIFLLAYLAPPSLAGTSGHTSAFHPYRRPSVPSTKLALDADVDIAMNWQANRPPLSPKQPGSSSDRSANSWFDPVQDTYVHRQVTARKKHRSPTPPPPPPPHSPAPHVSLPMENIRVYLDKLMRKNIEAALKNAPIEPFSKADMIFLILDSWARANFDLRPGKSIDLIILARCVNVFATTPSPRPAAVIERCKRAVTLVNQYSNAKPTITNDGTAKEILPGILSHLISQVSRRQQHHLPTPALDSTSLRAACTDDANLIDIMFRSPLTFILSTMARHAYILEMQLSHIPLDNARLEGYMVHLRCFQHALDTFQPIPKGVVDMHGEQQSTLYGAISTVIRDIHRYTPLPHRDGPLFKPTSKYRITGLSLFLKVLKALGLEEETHTRGLHDFITSWKFTHAQLIPPEERGDLPALEVWKSNLRQRLSSVYLVGGNAYSLTHAFL